MHFSINDSEALAVFIRFADCCGAKVVRVVPINDSFAVSVDSPVEVTSETNLKPFTNGVDRDRVYWSEIVSIDESALRFIGIEA